MDDRTNSIPASRATRRPRFVRATGGALLVAVAAIGGLSVARSTKPSLATPREDSLPSIGGDRYVSFAADLFIGIDDRVGTLVLMLDTHANEVCAAPFEWFDTDTFPSARVINEEGSQIWEGNLHHSGGEPVSERCYPEADLDVLLHRLRSGGLIRVIISTAEHPEVRAVGVFTELRPPARPETEVFESPIRAHDSRIQTGGKLTPGETRTIALPIPSGARAALVTVTVDQTEAFGYLTLYAADTPLPPTSNVNWTSSGQTAATSVIVNVDDFGRINVTNGPNSTHFIIDVTGHLN